MNSWLNQPYYRLNQPQRSNLPTEYKATLSVYACSVVSHIHIHISTYTILTCCLLSYKFPYTYSYVCMDTLITFWMYFSGIYNPIHIHNDTEQKNWVESLHCIKIMHLRIRFEDAEWKITVTLATVNMVINMNIWWCKWII